MDILEKVIKVGLAAMLLALLIVVGSVSVFGVTSGNLTQVTATGTKTQAAPANSSGTNQAITNPAVQTAPQQAQTGGVLDARVAVRKANPAVVTVINHMQATQSQGRFGNVQPEATASGSGVIFDNSGYIVTNNHVVEGESSLDIIFYDGKKTTAQLVGTDLYSDLAVLKVEGSVPAVATFGDSDKLELGQPVVAIGSALGDFENTVTAGIVSAVHREIQDANSTSLRDLIQTDAAINHGNSGGPLLDIEGNVVGINVAVVRGSATDSTDVAEGLGFSIPVNTVKEVTSQIVQNGAVSRPYLGISFETINEQIAAVGNLPVEAGVLITKVEADSPAGKAGIAVNSIITTFDGQAIDENNSLLSLLMKHKVGDTVKLKVISDGDKSEHEVTVTLAVRPPDK